MEGAPDVSLSTGMPENERKQRVVRIYKPAKNAMQSVRTKELLQSLVCYAVLLLLLYLHRMERNW